MAVNKDRKRTIDRGRTYKFTAPLDRLKGDFTWYFVEFPHDVVKEFGSRGSVRVKCLINGFAVDRALMPTKSGYHMIILGGDIRKAAKVRSPGDPVHVELRLDPEPDKIELPEELADTLDFMPEFKTAWNKLKPGMQRSMCYWISSAKTIPTKAKRVAEILKRFESGHPHFGGRKIKD